MAKRFIYRRLPWYVRPICNWLLDHVRVFYVGTLGTHYRCGPCAYLITHDRRIKIFSFTRHLQWIAAPAHRIQEGS